MREAPLPSNEGASFVGDTAARTTGDAKKLAAMQLYEVEAYSQGQCIHLNADPTTAELMNKIYREKKELLKNTKVNRVLNKCVPPHYPYFSQHEDSPAADEWRRLVPHSAVATLIPYFLFRRPRFPVGSASGAEHTCSVGPFATLRLRAGTAGRSTCSSHLRRCSSRRPRATSSTTALVRCSRDRRRPPRAQSTRRTCTHITTHASGAPFSTAPPCDGDTLTTTPLYTTRTVLVRLVSAQDTGRC